MGYITCFKKNIAIAMIGLSIFGISGCEKRQPSSSSEEITSSTAEVSTSVSSSTTSSTSTQVTVEPIEDKQMVLRMVGDDLLHVPVVESALQADGSYNFDHLFSHVKEDITAAGIGIINQETVLGGTEMGISGYPCFNSPQEVGDAIVNAGFDVVQEANNHAMDKGYAGLEATMNYWEKNHPEILTVGVNQNEAERNTTRIYEKEGVKFAFLSYTTSTNGIPLPSDKPWLVNMLNQEEVVADIQKAKEEADFVIVLPHWGVEYVTYATEEQKRTAQYMADAGADLIIGTHPHVLEPIEWIENASGGQTLVYYSLGNFVSNQSRPARMLGGMAEVTLDVTSDNTVTIQSASLVPLVTHYEWGNLQNSYTVYKLSEYNDTLATKNGVLKEETDDDGQVISKTFTMAWLDNLATEALGDWYGGLGNPIPVMTPPEQSSSSIEEESSEAAA